MIFCTYSSFTSEFHLPCIFIFIKKLLFCFFLSFSIYYK